MFLSSQISVIGCLILFIHAKGVLMKENVNPAGGQILGEGYATIPAISRC